MLATWLLPVTLAAVALTARRGGYRPENAVLMVAGILLLSLPNLWLSGGSVDVRTAELAVTSGSLGSLLYTWGVLRQNRGRWRAPREERRPVPGVEMRPGTGPHPGGTLR